MTATEWTWVGEHVPGIVGGAMLFAQPGDADHIRLSLLAGGYRVVTADTRTDPDRRAAITTLAAALQLPETVTNLDALADSLRDLADHRLGSRVVLLWSGSETLLERHLPDWFAVVRELENATVSLWDPDDEGAASNIVFETVVLLPGHGIARLAA